MNQQNQPYNNAQVPYTNAKAPYNNAQAPYNNQTAMVRQDCLQGAVVRNQRAAALSAQLQQLQAMNAQNQNQRRRNSVPNGFPGVYFQASTNPAQPQSLNVFQGNVYNYNQYNGQPQPIERPRPVAAPSVATQTMNIFKGDVYNKNICNYSNTNVPAMYNFIYNFNYGR